MSLQFDPGYGRSNSIDLLGDSGNGMGDSPVEASHISPFTESHHAYADAAAAAGLGAGAAGAYALHNRGYGQSTTDGYDNMTTTGGGSSYDDHTSYSHGMQPMNPYNGYATNAAYPSPAFNRTDYAPDMPNEPLRSPRWSGGWGVAAMGGIPTDGQQGQYYTRDPASGQLHSGGQAYPTSQPGHSRAPSDVDPMTSPPPMSAVAAAKRREAQGERTQASYGMAGPSGGPTSPPAGRTSVGSASWQGHDGAGASEAADRRVSERDLASSDDHRRPSVMVHTDGGSLLESAEAEQGLELPPT